MRSSFLVAGFLFLIPVIGLALPGEKRTILTSGEKVHTIRYQLGQSTILYFGMRPETVICGNKNYFHIDKLKEGLTIQALSNFSTNLTVFSQGKRFLFYLVPAQWRAPDAMVDVRWVPEEEMKVLSGSDARQTVKELNQKAKISDLEFSILRLISVTSSKRAIIEFQIRNNGKSTTSTSALRLSVVKGNTEIRRTTVVFEKDKILPGETVSGRLIVTGENLKGASLLVGFGSRKVKIQGGLN